MKGFTTKAVHGAPVKKDAHGTLRMPVYDSVAFEHETAENMQAAFEGRLPAHSYSRISNPTVEDYEQRVRLLADALGVIAVSSGMAAISNVIPGAGGGGNEHRHDAIAIRQYVFAVRKHLAAMGTGHQLRRPVEHRCAGRRDR